MRLRKVPANGRGCEMFNGPVRSGDGHLWAELVDIKSGCSLGSECVPECCREICKKSSAALCAVFFLLPLIRILESS